jgi:hypothetical protein
MAEAQAAERTQQTRFDQADRDRVRRALLRYMEDHRIGVPTLQKLIAEANDLALDHLPLKTLQRFLAGSHRSNDIIVRFCHRFSADLPDDDPLADLGEAVAAFIGARPDGAGLRPPPADMYGTFEGRAEPAKTGFAISPPGYDHWVPFSTLTIAGLPARPFAAVSETVTNWRRAAAESTVPARRTYDGVLFQPAGAHCALMRNILTGTLRLYWLGPATNEPFPFIGHGQEGIGPLDDPPATGPRLFRAERVNFMRIAGEKSP